MDANVDKFDSIDTVKLQLFANVPTMLITNIFAITLQSYSEKTNQIGIASYFSRVDVEEINTHFLNVIVSSFQSNNKLCSYVGPQLIYL